MRAAWGFWQDLSHGARMFAKNPGFTAIAVISIAFGTGANVAIFSVADALILRPLPVARPNELVTIGNRMVRGIFKSNVASYPDYVDIRSRSRSFDGLVAFASERVGLSVTPKAAPELRIATLVSANFFEVLGIEPPLGRGFLPEEDEVPGRDAVAVLSYSLWQQEFGADPAVLGRKIRIAGLDFTVVGVAPETFIGTDGRYRQSLYVPLAMWPRLITSRTINPLTTRDFRTMTVKGRLRRGVSMTEAEAELATIGQDLERAYPDTNKNRPIVAQTELQVAFERNPLDSGLMLLLSILSLAVLGVACANVAGLLASRAPVRAREIALRLAIGAGRGRLIRQLITESLGIALAGGAGGVAVGYLGILLGRQLRYPTDVIVFPKMQMDERALLFSLAVAMVSAFLFGLGPAMQTTRVNLSQALKNSDVSATRRIRLTGRSVLVTVQVALSLVLVTIAVYTFQLFRHEISQGPGFRITRIAKVSIDPSQARYTNDQSVRFFERALEEARRLPGAGHVTVTSAMPLYQLELLPVAPEGYHLPEGQTNVTPFASAIAEDYFETLEIPMVEGRAFRVTDTALSPRVAIVNETVARHYWPGQSAIGKRMRRNNQDGPAIEVVGVAKDSKYLYVGEPVQDFVYVPFRQEPRGNMVLVAQTAGDSATLLAPLRDMVRNLDADVPVYDAQTIEAFFDARATGIGRVVLTLVSAMGLMGVALTMVGLYGLVSYAVSRRTREIGIRIAVGASYERVLRMVLRQGMTPVWFGMFAGTVLSVVTLRVMPRVIALGPHYDSRANLLILPMLLVVTILAVLAPSLRAARVEPAVALRVD